MEYCCDILLCHAAVSYQALRKEYRGKDEVYAAAKGMLKNLGDPFTRFLTPQVRHTKLAWLLVARWPPRMRPAWVDEFKSCTSITV